MVAPLVGAWIETYMTMMWMQYLSVAPLVGAWIETQLTNQQKLNKMSHPSWVRGLKLRLERNLHTDTGRTPRGCVD